MKPIKDDTHVFIVRIRLETRELKNAKPIWRGVIEHFETEHFREEKLVYFDDLDELKSYFAQYLQEIGINVDRPGG